jgi:hypothetical protein
MFQSSKCVEAVGMGQNQSTRRCTVILKEARLSSAGAPRCTQWSRRRRRARYLPHAVRWTAIRKVQANAAAGPSAGLRRRRTLQRADERELADLPPRSGNEAIEAEPQGRIVLDDQQNRIVGGVVAATRDTPKRAAVGSAWRRVQAGMHVPLADIVLLAVGAIVDRVEISLKESRVAREEEAPVPRSRPWRAGSGDHEG